MGKKMRIGRSLLSLLMVAVLISTNIFGMIVISADEGHSHDGIEWQAWTSTNSLPTTAGNYYLTVNVSLSGTWTAPAGSTALDLNGHNISRGGELIRVDGSELLITDCQKSGVLSQTSTSASAISVLNGGTLNFKDVTITSKCNGIGLDGIGLDGNNSTANIYSGSISVTNNWKTVFNASGGARLNVYSGRFSSANHVAFYIIGDASATVEGGSFKGNVQGNVTIKGGYFDRNVGGFCASGYGCFASDNTSLGSYMVVPSHNWTYTANGDTITATCSGNAAGPCELSPQTLTIHAEGKTHDGQPVVATIETSDGWTAENGLIVPTEIVYSGNTDLGTHTASVTVGEVTASVSFTISRKTETKLEDEELGVTVEGLDLEVQSIEAENPEATSVSVVMTVEAKTEETAANADPILGTAKNQSLSFFEIKVEKTVDSVSTLLDETANVLEIVIPYANAGKKGVTVYSYHGTAVETLTESDSKASGTFRIDKENKVVYIYANRFSTYAIGYTPYYRVNTTLSLGSFEGTATVTLTNQDDGSVLTFENVVMGKTALTGVPQGQYRMTIDWEDGAKNTLTLPLTVKAKATTPSAPTGDEA